MLFALSESSLTLQVPTVLRRLHFEIPVTEDTINQPSHYLFAGKPFEKPEMYVTSINLLF